MATSMASPAPNKSSPSRIALPRLRRSESLSTIISQGGPLPEEQIWAVIDQLLAYLEGLHQAGKCHRCFSLTSVGFDSAGELEIASSEASLTISELVRLHAPLPSCLRHEFDLIVPRDVRDTAIALSHAGFSGDGVALDLFQVAVLTIRLIFDVDGEKFLASPCLQETLPPDLAESLRAILLTAAEAPRHAHQLRSVLPGATPVASPVSPPLVESLSEELAAHSSIEASVASASSLAAMSHLTNPSEVICTNDSTASLCVPSPQPVASTSAVGQSAPRTSQENSSIRKEVFIAIAAAILLLGTAIIASIAYFSS
jgi:hypothetical protein